MIVGFIKTYHCIIDFVREYKKKKKDRRIIINKLQPFFRSSSSIKIESSKNFRIGDRTKYCTYRLIAIIDNKVQ